MTATHTLQRGPSPLIVSVPHSGTAVPEDLVPRLTPLALTVPDTDWHVAELYDFAPALGASLIVARYSRYLIDLNRPPDDAALYAGAPRTGLCPVSSFAGEALYLAAGADAQPGAAGLGADEIAQRRRQYWDPYHDALRRLAAETRARHGYALLVDAHSIRSTVPRLFEGRLPDINLGTHDGRACAPLVGATVQARLEAAPRWSHVVNGRFKGGYITRHYGQPASGVHALQIELAQCAYMEESAPGEPGRYAPERAAALRALLRLVLEALLALPPERLRV